jgi:uncharacterized protein YjbI with pentapeptide repeats
MPIKLSQQQKRPPWLTRSNVLWGTGIALGLGVAIALATGSLRAGIGAGTTTVTSEKTDSQGKVIERTITTSTQDAKTLWDWLSLLGVPASLAGLGAWLQLRERKQDLIIAEGARQEEDLKDYRARVSDLLIEKNLRAIAAKDSPTTEETALLEDSVKQIQTLTLSILQRLSDGNRKASVVRFLVGADIIQRSGVSLPGADLKADITQRLKVSLRDADLSNANLVSVNLVRADLSNANLTQANLRGAYLNQAKLKGANLNSADLTGAYLNGADLTKTQFRYGGEFRSVDLRGANLKGANLHGANLEGTNLEGAKGLTKEQLEKAYLCRTTLPEGIDIVNLDRDCGTNYDTCLKKPPNTSTQIQQQP